MSYTNTKLHVTFDDTAFADEATDAAVTLSATPTLVDGVFGNAWQMDESTYVNYVVTEPSTAFSIGFWLKPNNPGVVTSPVDSTTEPVTLALLNKCDFGTSGSGPTEISYTAGSSILIYERTLDENKNCMVVSVSGITSPEEGSVSTSATIISSSYTTDVFHHFWIVYEGGTTKNIQIYIDLLSDSGASMTGYTPASILPNGYPLQLNYKAPGYQYNCARNGGVLDDFVFLSTSITSSSVIARAANMGAQYLADSDFSSIEEVSQCILFNDAGTVQVNSVFANRGNVYVSRTDGKLMRGVRSVWNSRRDFNSERELTSVTITSRGDSQATIENGAIKLTNEVIRI